MEIPIWICLNSPFPQSGWWCVHFWGLTSEWGILMDIYGYLIFMRISPKSDQCIPMWWLQSSGFPTSHPIPNSKQLLGEVAHVAIVPGHCSGAGQLRHLHDLLMNAAIHLLLAHVWHVPCKWGSLGSQRDPNYIYNYSGGFTAGTWILGRWRVWWQFCLVDLLRENFSTSRMPSEVSPMSRQGACRTCQIPPLPPSRAEWPSRFRCGRPSCCVLQSWREPAAPTQVVGFSAFRHCIILWLLDSTPSEKY